MTRRPKVLILGAGIGGLTAAIALRQVGISGEYAGATNMIGGHWHRLAFAVDMAAPMPLISKFVDGVKHSDQTRMEAETFSGKDAGKDARFSLLPTALLFTDDNGDTTAGYVNSIQFHNVKLTDEQIAALGGLSAEGIPYTVQNPLAPTQDGLRETRKVDPHQQP